MSALFILWRRELALAWAGGGGPLLACGFFLCLTVLVPLAAGGDPAGLRPVAGGIAWLALALASILSLERLFERDHEDGALDLIALGPIPLELVVLAKAKAQWLAVGAPLALTAPVAAVTLGLPPALAPLVALSALVGALARAANGLSPTPALAFLAAYVLFAAVITPFAGAAAIRNAQG